METDSSSVVLKMEKTDDPTTDKNSPYYTNHKEALEWETEFGSYPLRKDGKNYFTWKNHIFYVLKALRKEGFVDGTIVKPEESSPLYGPWKRNDAIVRFWLRKGISKEAKDLHSTLVYADTARTVWEHLRQSFGQAIDVRTFRLRRTISSLKQNGDSVTAYIEKLDKAWNELEAMEDEIYGGRDGGCDYGIAEKMKRQRETERLYGFLVGLDDEFKSVGIHILRQDPIPSVHQAYGTVLLAEEALAGELRRHGGDRSGRCSYCGRNGHDRDRCFKVFGYPPVRGQRRLKSHRKTA